MVLSPLLCRTQNFLCCSLISRDQLDFEVLWNSNQRRLELVVLNIVCVGRLRLAGNNLVCGQQAYESCV